MTIEEIYAEFVTQELAEERRVLEVFRGDLDSIANIDASGNRSLEDSLAFGSGIEILSNVAAFIFLVLATKLVDSGLEITRKLLYKTLLENKGKILRAVKQRYGTEAPERIYEKILEFLKNQEVSG